MFARDLSVISFSKLIRRGLVALVIATALALLPPSKAHAGFVIIAPDVTASAGSSGSFDVLIANTNTTGGASYSVSSDVLELALAGTTGVTLTGVSIATVTPYIYLSSGTTQPGGSPFSSDSFPNTGFTATDSEFSASDGFERMILAGQTFGLAHVSYTVAAGTAASSGMINIIDNPDGSATSLADVNGSSVNFTVMDGTFTVNASVPEPGSMLMTTTGVLVAYLGRRRSRAGRHVEPRLEPSGGHR